MLCKFEVCNYLKKMGKKFLGLILIYLIYSCTPNTEYKNLISDPETYNAVVKNLSDVVVYDTYFWVVLKKIGRAHV